MTNTSETKTVLRFRNRETIHLSEAIEIDLESRVVNITGAESDRIDFSELKAVFFLGQGGAKPTTGSHLSIEFDDGEVIRGIAPEYNPTRPGFYLYPEDEERVQKVLIIASAIVSIDVERL